MSHRRLAAILALLGAGVAVATAAYTLATSFPRGLLVMAGVLAAISAAWLGLVRRGGGRIVGFLAAALLIGVAIGALISGGNVLELVLIGAAFAIGLAGAGEAFAVRRSLPHADPPTRPVLFVNPRSGGGKASKFNLAQEAERRGIEVVGLGATDDLETLVRNSIARGANGLAMAGGDGSQAIVAAIAAEHDLPYACIPSGTRNHFALDLGVNRDDVIGALDAFHEGGGERRVDLGEVNGRVFVNNVSLGVYAEAVSQAGYREAKLQTLLATIPQTLGPDVSPSKLRWTDPEGVKRQSAAVMLISNNAYLLGPVPGSGTRPRLDEAVLGVVDFSPPAGGDSGAARGWSEMTVAELEVDCDRSVPTGIDGESVTLEPPLRFRSRPGALRVRIAHQHPGASPSAGIPGGTWEGLVSLIRIAAGRNPGSMGGG
ncbi:MAG: diacylglycerol kinase family protein [Solirubrobacterales bacterium]